MVLSFFDSVKKRNDNSIDLSESQVRYAMMHTKSNQEASRFMNMSYPTYRKYARMYIDQKTGQSLFDLHMNQAGKGMTKGLSEAFKRNSEARKKYTGEGVLANEFPNLTVGQIKKILIRDGFLQERCCKCGLDEKRVWDKRTPLILHFKDGNHLNCDYNNLELVCYNCYFYNIGEVRRGRPTRVVVIPGEHATIIRQQLV